MKIDLTDAARAMGVHEPPQIAHIAALERDIAFYDWPQRRITLNRARLAEVAGNRLIHPSRWPGIRSYTDRIRWVMAHELAHELQRQRFNNDWRFNLTMVGQYHYAARAGLPHHHIPMEAEADALARRFWRYVKINGRGPRGGVR